jgi:hypothetical protein
MPGPDAVAHAVAGGAAEGCGVVIYGRGGSPGAAGLRHGCGGALRGIGDVVSAQILRDLGVRSVRLDDGFSAVTG